ncbi:MAG: WYL domain-containing protein [Chloroflexota bacterium]
MREVIVGRAPFPPLISEPETDWPVEKSQALIETALATGQALQMSYFSPGWDQLTRRLVEPYRLERRGDTAYLIGFCHRAQAERMFRLDRIREVAIATQTKAGDSESDSEMGSWTELL